MFMSKEMNRRDFLKVSAVTGASILASDLFSTDPIAYGAVDLPEAERIAITIIEDNYYDSLRGTTRSPRDSTAICTPSTAWLSILKP
jgi:TAT (twin-arginine translocation) pathway-exported protein